MFQKPSKQQTKRLVKSYSLPAPVKGLNTRDPLSAMEAGYAIELTNFICTPQGVTTRNGYRAWATGLPGWVKGLIPHRATNGTSRLFAVSNGGIYNVTNPGAVGSALVTGLVGNEFRSVNFLSSAGNYAIMCNGVDPTYHYDGTNWVQWTNVGSPVTPGQINGINPALFLNVISHQRRLWFVETNSTRAWYLPINSVGGVATPFDFGPQFPRGGRLTALCSWSINGGTGMQNMLCAVSEFGDAVIYQGTDPSSSTDWQIKGSWRLAPPVNTNCFLNFGGDALYMSQDGLLPLTAYLQSGLITSAISDAIRLTIADLCDVYGSLSGWTIHDCPKDNLIIINIPQVDPASNLQLCFHTITGAWSVLTGMPAQSWVTLGNIELFGGNGVVYQAFWGTRDAAAYDGTGGTPYVTSAKQSYNYFEDRARNKRFTMARINLISSTVDPKVLLGVNTDFNIIDNGTISPFTSTSSGIWTTGVWNVARWSGSIINTNTWQSVSGIGYCASIAVSLSVNSQTTWTATDVQFEQGGLIG